ncbi:MAG: FG-GAP-like repeat-containing protein [Thermoplasmata archaeon]
MRKLKRAGLLFASLIAVSVFLSACPSSRGLPSLSDNVVIIEAPGMGHIIVDDFNSDGLDDMAVASYTHNSVFIYFSTPVGMPTNPTTRIYAVLPSEIASGDVDMDGEPELLVLGEDRVAVYDRVFPDQFLPTTSLFVNHPRDVAVGDSGADGRNDIFVTGSFGTTIFFQDPDSPGVFNPARKHNEPTAQGDSLSLARINDDDLVDFVVSSSYHLTSYVELGPTGYRIDSTFMLDRMDYNPEYTSVGDVNSDGRPDIVIPRPIYHGGESGVLKILFSDEFGGFSLSNGIDVYGDFSTSTLVDFENDGTNDVLVSLTDGNVDVVSQSSGFTLPARPFITMPEPEGIRILASGDFNGDSLVDVVVRVAGCVYLYFMEDLPVRFVMPIPSTFHINEGEAQDALIDLSPYFYDDYSAISYALVYEEDSSKLDATLSGHFLDFSASPGWSGSMRFQVEVWDGNPNNNPARSNLFSVWVNDAPRIVSVPSTAADVDDQYAYQVVVEDDFPQWGEITYKLTAGSSGMTIGEDGLLAWTPDDSGTTAVQIEVRDVFGLSDVQTFEIVVAPVATPPPDLPPETTYVVGTVAATVSTIAIAALISENVKFALFLLFVPLYTKIRREKVLDHFIRGQIYGYILANPGEHYNAIKQALGLTNGSLAHHLKTLEREEFIKSRKFGLYRRFYPKHMKIPEDGDFRMNAIQKHIVDVIDEHPGISQKEIAKAMNITPPTVNYHIGILSSAKRIRVIRQGRKTECFVDKS